MADRTLSLAAMAVGTVMAAASPVAAQNLEAGKTPSQIFSSTCSACHRGSKGLVKTVPAGSLPGFLREHYTTSSNMASALSAYLISGGGADGRQGVVPARPTVAVNPDGTPPAEANGPPGRKQRQAATPRTEDNPAVPTEGAPPPRETRRERLAKAAAAKADAKKNAPKDTARIEQGTTEPGTTDPGKTSPAKTTGPAKTEVAAVPPTGAPATPASAPKLVDIGTKPAEMPAHAAASPAPAEPAAARQDAVKVDSKPDVKSEPASQTAAKSADPEARSQDRPDARPTDARPAETKPAETKPTEAKPTETKTVVSAPPDQANSGSPKADSSAPAARVETKPAEASAVTAAAASSAQPAQKAKGPVTTPSPVNPNAPPPSPPISY